MKTADENQKNSEMTQDSGTRQKIVEAAREEFAKHGLDGARVDRIAKCASVNKAMLYYHFRSKENLYEAVIKDFFSIIGGRIHQQIINATSMEEALAGLANVHASVMAEFPNVRPIMLRELAEPHGDLLDWISEKLSSEGVSKAARHRLEEKMESGEFRKIDIRQSMVSFVTMSLGYFLLSPLMDRVWNVTDRESFIEERKKAIVDLFLYGVKVR
jgi:TetR/AcrR family transcriptional regulator